MIRGVVAVALLVGAGWPAIGGAQAKKVAIKGSVQGGDFLLNPVWVEANDPKNHRYSFRTRSTSAGKQQRPTAYLPKELCVAVLKKEGASEAVGTPLTIGVSGGRTTPVTVVVQEGRPVQFINHDPFPHKLYDVGSGGLGPEETRSGGNRTWKPPKPGVYEIRDQLAPSVRAWVVVEPRVVQFGHPRISGEYVVRDLEPGNYDLQGYFMGKPVGKSLSIEVRSTGDEQEIRDPLVVADEKSSGNEGK